MDKFWRGILLNREIFYILGLGLWLVLLLVALGCRGRGEFGSEILPGNTLVEAPEGEGNLKVSIRKLEDAVGEVQRRVERIDARKEPVGAVEATATPAEGIDWESRARHWEDEAEYWKRKCEGASDEWGGEY